MAFRGKALGRRSCAVLGGASNHYPGILGAPYLIRYVCGPVKHFLLGNLPPDFDVQRFLYLRDLTPNLILRLSTELSMVSPNCAGRFGHFH
jgi:hypothetical protein